MYQKNTGYVTKEQYDNVCGSFDVPQTGFETSLVKIQSFGVRCWHKKWSKLKLLQKAR